MNTYANDRGLNSVELIEFLTDNANLCGSRFMISPYELSKDTDYDFYVYESEEEELLLELKRIGVFPNKHQALSGSYTDGITIQLYKFFIDNIIIELTIKKDEYRKPLQQFWNKMKRDPDLYRQKYWKKNSSAEIVMKNFKEYFGTN